MSQLATILEIQRMSTEDGPGLRSTVFFKGCSLDCSWCHNPESIKSTPELIWHDWRCIGCRSCVEACWQGARTLSLNDGMLVDRSKCRDCGSCLDECPAIAIERQGRRMSLEEVLDELTKDRAFYAASSGGVTLSGGEPTLQPDMVGALLDHCRELGIHTALDTCGHCGLTPLMELAAKADLVLYDLKELNEERHKRYTGKSNKKIVENLKHLAAAIREGSCQTELWIRTPLIPGATAREETIQKIGAFLADEVGSALSRWELCAFNNLCADKYRRLGRKWAFEQAELLEERQVEILVHMARSSGVPAELVRVSGPTKHVPSVGWRMTPAEPVDAPLERP